MAVYLLPAAVLVFAVGGVLIAVLGVVNGVNWVASKAMVSLRGRVTPRINRGAYRGLNVSPETLGGRSPVSTTVSRTRRPSNDLDN